MARTFIQARSEILATLAVNGWAVSGYLKVPHATSPSGKFRLWFKAQAVYSSEGDWHQFKDAHTLSYSLDIRKLSAVAFVTWIAKRYPDSGQPLPVTPSPYATTASLVEKPRPGTPKRPSYRPPARVVPIRRGPVATYEEAERALKDIGYLDERELRALLNEYGVHYHPLDNLHVLRELARDALAHYGEMPEPGEIPPSAVPQASPDPRQLRWAAAGKRRHAPKNSGVGKVHRELKSLLRR